MSDLRKADRGLNFDEDITILLLRNAVEMRYHADAADMSVYKRLRNAENLSLNHISTKMFAKYDLEVRKT